MTTESTNPPGEAPARPPFFNWRFLVWLVFALVLLGGALVAGGLVGLALSFRNLPDVRVLKNYVPSEATRITDIKGQVLAVISNEANRKVVPLKQISPNLRQAVLAIEDDRFYQHSGIRVDTLVRAAYANLQEGRTVQGGSTITQQLIKNLFLTPERSLDRKVAEAVLSLRLEQVFKKNQILEMYLNQIYWGSGAYGIETAARTYFNKSASKLDLAEAALLAGMLRAPENYSPIRNPAKTLARQRVVLDRMAELGWIAPSEAERAKARKLVFKQVGENLVSTRAPYFINYVEQELKRKYGNDAVYKGGLQVQTTLDLKMQELAERTVTNAARSLRARRAGELALVAMDPRTGYIKAMVGGVNFKASQYNRATQARRQPGSTFKPFVYYTALASGRYTPDTIVEDSPVSFGNYSPKNYDLRFYGAMTVRQALAQSRNVPVVKIANRIGMNQVILQSRRAGITSPLAPNLATAIGSGGISPLELARGYSAFANGGYRVTPTAILQVTDQQGNILEQNLPVREHTLKAGPVKMLNQMLQGVISAGTGTRAQLAAGRPAAGKTGTTQDFRDAWFAGYVPQLVAVIWVGNDDFSKTLARSTAGGTYVAPIWKGFMDQALKGQPVLPFPGLEAPKPDEAKTALTAPPEEAPKPRRRRRVRRTPEAALELKAAPAPETVPEEPTPPESPPTP